MVAIPIFSHQICVCILFSRHDSRLKIDIDLAEDVSKCGYHRILLSNKRESSEFFASNW
jgi:hypothetical protein